MRFAQILLRDTPILKTLGLDPYRPLGRNPFGLEAINHLESASSRIGAAMISLPSLALAPAPLVNAPFSIAQNH